MGLENVKYDAFISYRHSDLDKFNAMTIQRKLENFKLPKSLYGKTANGKTKIARVFRDQDELPLASNLSDPIQMALENSEFLIVICTPRLLESQWCAKEIETFIKLHGREHVLAVLAEGEPEQSFPDALRFATKIVLDEKGNEHEETVELEPLAADTRGSNQRERKKMIDDATLRLAAPLFGLNYDDLKQRHKEQRTKKIITIASSIAAVFFIFAMVCMGLALRISSQKNTIEEQYNEIEAKNIEIEANNKAITAQNEEISAQNETIRSQYRAEQVKYAESMADVSKELLTKGRKKDALYAIRNAMPSTKDGLDIPYTSASERALADALGVYNGEGILTPVACYELNASPKVTRISPDGRHVLILDTQDQFSVFDADTGEKTTEFYGFFVEENPEWVNNEAFAYIDGGALYVFDIVSCENYLIHDCAKKFLVDTNKDVLYVYEYECDYNTYEESLFLSAYETSGDYVKKYSTQTNLSDDFLDYYFCQKLMTNESGSLVAVISESEGEQRITLSVVMADSGLLILEEQLECPLFQDAALSDRSVYILSQWSVFLETYVSDSFLYSISLTTGDLEWEKDYREADINRINYLDYGTPRLLLDTAHMMTFINADNGNQIKTVPFSREMVNSYFLPYEDSFMRLMVMQDGSILSYTDGDEEAMDASYTLYKYINQEAVSGFQMFDTSYYFNYENNNYVVRFDRYDSEGTKDYAEMSEIAGDNAYSAKYSDDYRYALTTVSSYGSDGEWKYTHTLYDLVKGTLACSITDDLPSVDFIRGEKDRFVIYSNEVRIYDFSGNPVYEKSFDNYSPYVDYSADGSCLLFYDNASGMRIAFSLLSEKELLSWYSPYDYEEVFAVEAADRIVIAHGESVDIYSINNSDPIASLNIRYDYFTDFALSDDGKYLFVSAADYTMDIYSVPELNKIKTVYFMNSGISKAIYCEGINSYLLKTFNGNAYLFDAGFECIADICRADGYIPAEKCFIIRDGEMLYKTQILSYEELVNMADDILKGYEPSEFIKSKYHFE